jgi:NitT/TauT family transport system substrate-binding protein
MKKTTWWRTSVAVLAAGVLMAGCAAGGASTTAPENEVSEETDSATLTAVTWMSPRGSIDVMDDYALHTAIEMGYFEEMGLEVTLEPGPTDGSASTKFVAEGKAGISPPSPGVLASSIEAGVAVKGIYNLIAGQLFNFAVATDSDISSIADLEGKSIALGSIAWRSIVDPILAEAGVDLDSVTYIEAGAQYGQAVMLGEADAALGWEGMRAQWAAQGIDVKWVLGRDFSVQPSNTLVVAVADLETAEGVDKWTRFLKGLVMGEEFARANPACSAQITYGRLPDMASTLEPQAALDAMQEIQAMYSLSMFAGDGWGWHSPEGWTEYLSIAADIGLTSSVLDIDEVFTNELLKEANNVDVDSVKADAAACELNSDFATLKVS